MSAKRLSNGGNVILHITDLNLRILHTLRINATDDAIAKTSTV